MHNIDFNDLRYIGAVCASGSLSAAARQLGVNHATVFRRIVQLEKALGVRLFERIGGRYIATSAGEELAQASSAMQALADQSILKVMGQDLQPSGSVRITTTDSVAKALLNPILQLCRQRYPQIQLHIGIDNAMLDLSKRDADIAIRPAMQPPEYLIGKRIGALAFAVYGAADYLAANAELALPQHQWLALSERQERHRSLQWLSNIVDLNQVAYRIDGFAALTQACASGLGLAVLPCFLGDSTAPLKRVQNLPTELQSELWILTHPDLRETVRIKAIFQILYEELSKQAGLLAGEEVG